MRLKFFKETKEQQATSSESKRHLYLVDFENTKKDGLYGLESLDDTSEVIVFFGSQDKSIPIDCHNMIVNANAIVAEIQMEKTNKNYLDFQYFLPDIDCLHLSFYLQCSHFLYL